MESSFAKQSNAASKEASRLLPMSMLVTLHVRGLGKASAHKHCTIENEIYEGHSFAAFNWQSVCFFSVDLFYSSYQLYRSCMMLSGAVISLLSAACKWWMVNVSKGNDLIPYPQML